MYSSMEPNGKLLYTYIIFTCVCMYYILYITYNTERIVWALAWSLATRPFHIRVNVFGYRENLVHSLRSETLTQIGVDNSNLNFFPDSFISAATAVQSLPDDRQNDLKIRKKPIFAEIIFKYRQRSSLHPLSSFALKKPLYNLPNIYPFWLKFPTKSRGLYV